MVLVEKKNQTVRIFEQTPVKAAQMSVRYTFLEGADATYTGMAAAYRDYLLEQGLKPKTTALQTAL